VAVAADHDRAGIGRNETTEGNFLAWQPMSTLKRLGAESGSE